MTCDLRAILDGWEFQPGMISVRKIMGRDGREKIQTRIDLGLLQFDVEGRPDGTRPGGFASLLEMHEKTLLDHVAEHGSDEDFILSSEQCHELRHEAYLYYQRYLSLFVLEEFDQVAGDTAHNQRVVDLCGRYGATSQDRDMLRAQRPYVMMMNIRARAYAATQSNGHEAAATIVDAGIHALEQLDDACDHEGAVDASHEIGVLTELREEVIAQMADDSPPKLRHQLERAVEREDYELAAELRDRLSRVAAPRHAQSRARRHY